MTRNVAVFAIAALLEIAGCFAFWAWLRRGVTPFVLVLGITSLIGFALALTRVDSAFAGRVCRLRRHLHHGIACLALDCGRSSPDAG